MNEALARLAYDLSTPTLTASADHPRIAAPACSRVRLLERDPINALQAAEQR